MSDHAEHHAPRFELGSQRLLAGAIALVVLIGAGLFAAQAGIGGSSKGSPPRLVHASAAGIEVRVPGQPVQRLAAAQPIAGTHPTASQSLPTYSYPADGSLVAVTSIAASARLGAASTAASSQVDVGSIKLFNGRVTLTGVSMRSASAVHNKIAGGTIGLTPGATLLVDGKAQDLAANHQIVIPNVGTVSINEQAVVTAAPKGDALTGPRHRVVGAAIHVRLSTAYAGAPAGTQLIIGRVESGVRDRKIVAAKPPKTGVVAPVKHLAKPAAAAPTSTFTAPTSSSTGLFGVQTGQPKPGETTLPRKNATVRGAAAGQATGNLQGYVFPVLSDAAAFTNDFGAMRADVPQGHQGNDIFAPEGTPIVAVADGVLDRVGWNTVGGYRFWLFDQYGNGFYHAHLSAYAPIAVDGAHVHAGDVIGFVGHTGDAQGTPDHLHFEIHPNNGAATNPFPFITAWQRGVAVAISALASATGGASGTAPITLLSAADIAANSGLEQSVLAEVHSATRPISQESAGAPSATATKQALDGSGISAAG